MKNKFINQLIFVIARIWKLIGVLNDILLGSLVYDVTRYYYLLRFVTLPDCRKNKVFETVKIIILLLFYSYIYSYYFSMKYPTLDNLVIVFALLFGFVLLGLTYGFVRFLLRKFFSIKLAPLFTQGIIVVTVILTHILIIQILTIIALKNETILYYINPHCLEEYNLLLFMAVLYFFLGFVFWFTVHSISYLAQRETLFKISGIRSEMFMRIDKRMQGIIKFSNNEYGADPTTFYIQPRMLRKLLSSLTFSYILFLILKFTCVIVL